MSLVASISGRATYGPVYGLHAYGLHDCSTHMSRVVALLCVLFGPRVVDAASTSCGGDSSKGIGELVAYHPLAASSTAFATATLAILATLSILRRRPHVNKQSCSMRRPLARMAQIIVSDSPKLLQRSVSRIVLGLAQKGRGAVRPHAFLALLLIPMPAHALCNNECTSSGVSIKYARLWAQLYKVTQSAGNGCGNQDSSGWLGSKTVEECAAACRLRGLPYFTSATAAGGMVIASAPALVHKRAAMDMWVDMPFGGVAGPVGVPAFWAPAKRRLSVRPCATRTARQKAS